MFSIAWITSLFLQFSGKEGIIALREFQLYQCKSRAMVNLPHCRVPYCLDIFYSVDEYKHSIQTSICFFRVRFSRRNDCSLNSCQFLGSQIICRQNCQPRSQPGSK